MAIRYILTPLTESELISAAEAVSGLTILTLYIPHVYFIYIEVIHLSQNIKLDETETCHTYIWYISECLPLVIAACFTVILIFSLFFCLCLIG